MTDEILAAKLDIQKNACIEIFGLNNRLSIKNSAVCREKIRRHIFQV